MAKSSGRRPCNAPLQRPPSGTQFATTWDALKNGTFAGKERAPQGELSKNTPGAGGSPFLRLPFLVDHFEGKPKKEPILEVHQFDTCPCSGFLFWYSLDHLRPA